MGKSVKQIAYWVCPKSFFNEGIKTNDRKWIFQEVGFNIQATQQTKMFCAEGDIPFIHINVECSSPWDLEMDQWTSKQTFACAEFRTIVCFIRIWPAILCFVTIALTNCMHNSNPLTLNGIFRWVQHWLQGFRNLRFRNVYSMTDLLWHGFNWPK